MSRSDKRKQYGEKYALWLRNYQRARARALTRLGQKYPDEYQLLLEEERAKDEAEGKSWLDLTGRTKRSMGGAGAPDGRGKVPVIHTDQDGAAEGELG